MQKNPSIICACHFFVVLRPPPPFMGSPSKVRSRPAGYTQACSFFCMTLLPSLLIIVRLRPRRIGICPVKTVVSAWGSGRKGALGTPVFEGHIRYPHGLMAHYNRGVTPPIQKNVLRNLRICNFCCTFAAENV